LNGCFYSAGWHCTKGSAFLATGRSYHRDQSVSRHSTDRSPIFATQRGSMGLTEEEDRIAIDLNERGYAVLDFPDPEIDARIDRIKANLGPRYAGIDFADPHGDKTQVNGASRMRGSSMRMCVRSRQTRQSSIFWASFTGAGRFPSRR
jgi:hypothetical protein